MGKKLEEYKKNNIRKIRIGSCVELFLLLNNFYTDFDKVSSFINDNDFLLNNQNKSIILEQLEDIKNVLVKTIDMVISDIDKDCEFMEYMLKAY